MTHVCVGKQSIIGSDNGLSPGRRQAIIWTNAGILLIGPLGTNFSEISIKIQIFSFTKMRLKVSSTKWRPFCLGLNVLFYHDIPVHNLRNSLVGECGCSDVILESRAMLVWNSPLRFLVPSWVNRDYVMTRQILPALLALCELKRPVIYLHKSCFCC